MAHVRSLDVLVTAVLGGSLVVVALVHVEPGLLVRRQRVFAAAGEPRVELVVDLDGLGEEGRWLVPHIVAG